MKRILSLFLSMVLVFSMVLGTFTVNVFAEVTGGAFKNAAGEMVKEFIEDFDSWNASYWEAKVAASNYANGVVDANSNQTFSVTSRVHNSSGNAKKMMPVEILTESGTDKFIRFKDVQSDGYYKERFYFNLGGSDIQEASAEETVYISIDLRVGDSNYRKMFGSSDHLNTEQKGDFVRFIEFTSDGYIKLFDQNIDNYAYSSGEWYNFDFLWSNGQVKCYINDVLVSTQSKDYNSYINTSRKMLGFAITHLSNADKVLYTPDAADAILDANNLQIIFFDENSIVTSKPSITSVGSAGNKVSYDATQISFTMDGSLPDLKAEHIKFTPANAATSINVTSDGADNYTVTAQLENELLPWTNYTLEIDRACFSDAKYEISPAGFPVLVDNISANFDVTPAPFAVKAPDFYVLGNTLTAETTFVNNTSDSKWAYFMLVNKDSNGIVKNIETASKKDITTGESGISVTLESADFTEGSAEFFVIDGYTNELLFDVCYGYNYDETSYEDETPVATSDANAGEITLGDFNYTTKKMDVNINVGSDAGSVNGVLYIYKRGTAMKDNLIYADYLTTTANGSLKKEVTFAPDITDVTGEYTVSFYSEGIKYTKDFPIYDAEANQTSDLGSVEFDMTGQDAVTGYGSTVISDTYAYYPGYSGKYANFVRFSNATATNIVTIDGEAAVAHRANKADGSGTDGYVTMYLSNDAVKTPGGKTSGKYIISGSLWATSDGFASTGMTFARGSDFAKTLTPWTKESPIKAKTWYNFEITVDLDAADGNNLFVTVTEDAPAGQVFTDSDRFTGASLGSVRIDWDFAELTYDNYIAYKNLKLVSFTGVNKPVIRYIGTDGVVEYDQNKVSFKISEDKGLAKENINVFDESQGTIIKAKSITVTEDMGEYFIEATLEKNLSSNKTYTLMVDAVGYEAYVEDDAGSIVPTKPISRTFTTAPAPIDITKPVITSDGSSVTFESAISNTSGSLVNATALLVVVNSDGIMQSVTADADSVANSNTGSFTNTNAFESGNTAKYFVIKDFADPKPLFKKYWTVNYDGSLPEADASVATTKAAAEKIVLNEFEYNTKFDHKNNKIVVNLNTGKNAVTEGVLYVYSDVLSDGNIVYADYVTTAADGTLLKEIKFDSSIASATKEYKVAFWSNDVEAAIEDSFNVYKAADYTNYKRNNIFANAVKSSTFSGLKQIITGTNDSGAVINDAWTIFAGDTYTADYEVLKNKEAVFVSLSSTVKSLADYDALCRAFERLSLVQKNKENTPQASNPSANNRNPGSSSVSMSATPSKSSNAGSSVGGGSVFSDMTGHWAQKHAEALVARGIVNGYADGSFRGDSPITRAELTKIIVEALDVPEKEGKNFGDVAQSSWYSSYVSRAATAGVINGFEDGSFKPEANVSRQDAVLMIWRAMNLTSELPEGFKYFADEKDIQDYASEAIRCLGDLGIVTGEKSGFKPLNNITRAEMAAVICRAIDYIESHLQ